jgi:hypothetical protein
VGGFPQAATELELIDSNSEELGPTMAEGVWLSLTARERVVLQQALAAYSGAQVADVAGAESLMTKLQTEERYPAITIGVYGGLVQWVMGNPFPIRICDYDGERGDLPDIDERNQRCTIGFAPADIEDSA